MKPNHKLSRTIAAILSASAAHAILAANAGPNAGGCRCGTGERRQLRKRCRR